VPWCKTCDRFLNPPTVNPDGSCPHCGQFVEPGHAHEAAEYRGEVDPAEAAAQEWDRDADKTGLPWHLKLILLALALYLGWRAYEALAWTIGRVA
jgi:hypothetical protein